MDTKETKTSNSEGGYLIPEVSSRRVWKDPELEVAIGPILEELDALCENILRARNALYESATTEETFNLSKHVLDAVRKIRMDKEKGDHD
jgi:hypothetical protein